MHNARACQTEEVKVSRRSLCESVPRVITIHFPYLIYHCRWKSTKSRWRGVINYRSARYRGACANAHKSLPFTRITTPIIFTRCYVHTRYIQKNFLSRKPSFESRRDEKNARIKFRGDKRLDGSKARKYPRNWLSIDFAESISNLYDHDAHDCTATLHPSQLRKPFFLYKNYSTIGPSKYTCHEASLRRLIHGLSFLDRRSNLPRSKFVPKRTPPRDVTLFITPYRAVGNTLN